MTAFLEVVGTIPLETTSRYQSELPWLRNLLTSTKEEIRELAAKIYGVVAAHIPSGEFEKQVAEMINVTRNKMLETQHGAILALSYMMERKLMLRRNENRSELLKWESYIDATKLICEETFSSHYQSFNSRKKHDPHVHNLPILMFFRHILER